MLEVINVTSITLSIAIKVLPSVFLGLFLANITAVRSLSDRGARLISVLGNITGLPSSLVSVLILTIGDRTAGMASLAMTKRYYGFDDKQIMAVNLLAKAPSVLQFFVFSFIPITLSLFPFVIALQFLISYFLVFIFISMIGGFMVRYYFQHTQFGGVYNMTGKPNLPWPEAVAGAVVKSVRPFIRIACWLLGSTFLVIWITRSGAITWWRDLVPFAGSWVSPEIIPLLSTGIVSMVGGVAAIGAGYQEGLIPADRIVPLLFSVSIVHNFYDLCTASIPRYAAVFGSKLGLKISVSGFLVTQSVMILFLLAILQLL